MTDGRGTDAAIDAVGMEAHGAPVGEVAQTAVGLLPAVAAKLIEKPGDRPDAGAVRVRSSAVRRGGTVSISGVYGGMADPFPMMELFDKGVQLRMGQAT